MAVAEKKSPAKTLLEMLHATASRYPSSPALSAKQQGRFQALTYQELEARVRQFASGLAVLGVKPGQPVGLVAENCPEWVICDFGILTAGGVNVALFPSLPARQLEYCLADSGVWLLIVGNTRLLEKALVVRQTMPDLQIILLAEEAPDDDPGVFTFRQIMDLGARQPLSETLLETIRAASSSSTLASIVYTSGTSGEQKGVMLSHGNFLANVRQCQQVLHFLPEDVLLSVLPLNHVFERTAGCYLPLACGAQIAYAESLRRLRENLLEVRPTYLILVPRFFEVLRDALVDRMQKSDPRRSRLFFWAIDASKRYVRCKLQGRYVPPWLVLEHTLAERLVLRKVREGIGLDRTRLMVSGAAALAIDVNEFFHALGLNVLEGYGLTEAAPVVAVNRPGQIELGTVGPALPGIEMKLGDLGEILVRGDNVMLGYYNKPEATALALDAEGWLHTGDVGEMNADGRLRITDRLKDLLVLTSGKNVAPQPIENALHASPYINQAVVLGDRHQYVTALIVPAFSRLYHWAQVKQVPLSQSNSEVIADRMVQQLIRDEIRRLTEGLADFEKVRDFRLLADEFTIEGGELTPTQKVKRRVVMEKYATLIADMYH